MLYTTVFELYGGSGGSLTTTIPIPVVGSSWRMMAGAFTSQASYITVYMRWVVI